MRSAIAIALFLVIARTAAASPEAAGEAPVPVAAVAPSGLIDERAEGERGAGATARPNGRAGGIEVCGTNGGLNFRGAPSMTGRVIDQLPDEYDLVVLGTGGNGGWLKVRDEGGRTGWVAKKFTCKDDGADIAVGPWQDPAPGACVSSPFGPRKRPCIACSKNHRGIDLAVCNKAVGAAADGRVLAAKWDRKGGNYVAVDHGAGIVSYYLHLKKCEVKPGDKITAGTRVGMAGNSGSATTGCHLHFEIRMNGLSVDPQPLLAAGKRLEASASASPPIRR